MRFWKTAAAAAIVAGAAAAIQLGGAEAHGQVVRERDIGEPLEHAMQVLTVGGGSRIGVSIADITAEDVAAKKLPSESGVLIQQVEDDTPASRAGLRAGDVILEFDGERVRSVSQLTRLIRETPAGRRIAMPVSRDGQRVTVTIEPEAPRAVAPLLRRFEATPGARAPRPPSPPMVYRPTPAPEVRRVLPHVEVFPDGGFAFSPARGRLGVSTQTLTDQLANHFGVDGGVLVSSVTENSAASTAGLRAGDVITKLNATVIDDAGDLLRALDDASGEVTLEIVRDRKTQTLKATLEPARRRTMRRVI